MHTRGPPPPTQCPETAQSNLAPRRHGPMMRQLNPRMQSDAIATDATTSKPISRCMQQPKSARKPAKARQAARSNVGNSAQPSDTTQTIKYCGADERTRTFTGVTPQRPQRCASTNSATSARDLKVGRRAYSIGPPRCQGGIRGFDIGCGAGHHYGNAKGCTWSNGSSRRG
jgi:hypothetical protein